MIKEFDTIAAIATSVGEGSISIIRISGSDSLKIASKIFKNINGSNILEMKTYTMKYGHIVSLDSGETIDEVILSYMKGPKSFTGEDVVEINCHGGVIAIKRVLSEILKAGARSAMPGEFSKRAFLNGRVDLSQAEAIMDIINAKTELSMKNAIIQSSGRLSKDIQELRGRLLENIAHIEATVDYPEDDLEEVTSEKTIKEIQEILEQVKKLLDTSEEGKIIRDGLSTVIVGKPNVGKSSLLNVLTHEKRAIVTDVPGTTRDVIEEYISIDGVPIKIIDTAGIRETEDLVEKIGVEKSKQKIEEADLVVLMLDSSEKLDLEDEEIIRYIKNKKYIVLLNKCDLEKKINLSELDTLNSKYIINISTKDKVGIDKFKEAIKELFFNGEINSSELMITNERHKEALYRADESLRASIGALKDTYAIDLASIDIRNAWYALGEINGETVEEDLIDKIFSEFCLGK